MIGDLDPEGFGACWLRTPFTPEGRIVDELLEWIRANPNVCARIVHTPDDGDLIKITCDRDNPVIYRVCEADLISETHVIRFPD